MSKVAKDEIRNGSNIMSFIFAKAKLKALKSCLFIFAMTIRNEILSKRLGKIGEGGAQ